MRCEAIRVNPEETADVRDRYCREMNAQIVNYSWLARGFCDAFALRLDGDTIGYGLVGGIGSDPRNTVTEFYIVPEHRAHASALFQRLIAASGATAIVAQSNDGLLSLVLRGRAREIEEGAVLFGDAHTTTLPAPGRAGVFRRLAPRERDRVFAHRAEPVGDWGIELDGEIVATGGVLLHYNPPFADLHMEVAEPFRRRGVGSYLVQELKRECRELGHTPAARCNPENAASRACLERAGFAVCGRMLRGSIAAP